MKNKYFDNIRNKKLEQPAPYHVILDDDDNDFRTRIFGCSMSM